MVIEWLVFELPIALQAEFIQLDETLWRPYLAQQPGYLGKETWRSPDPTDPEGSTTLSPTATTRLMIIVRWASREHWHAVPAAEMEEIEQKFAQRFAGSYRLVESREYEVIQPGSTGG